MGGGSSSREGSESNSLAYSQNFKDPVADIDVRLRGETAPGRSNPLDRGYKTFSSPATKYSGVVENFRTSCVNALQNRNVSVIMTLHSRFVTAPTDEPQ